MFYLIIYTKAHTTTSAGTLQDVSSAHHHRHHLGTLGGVLASMSTTASAGTSSGCQQSTTTGYRWRAPPRHPGRWSEPAGHPRHLFEGIRHPSRRAGGIFAAIQGEGGGGAHPVRRRSSASVGLFFRGGYSEYQIFTSDFGRHATTAPLKSVAIFDKHYTLTLGCAK